MKNKGVSLHSGPVVLYTGIPASISFPTDKLVSCIGQRVDLRQNLPRRYYPLMAHLTGRLFLLYALSLFGFYDPEKYYALSFGKEGKPRFQDSKLPYFSISHSGSHAALALSADPVGLDIERTHRRKMEREVAQRYFSSGEYENYIKAPVFRRGDIFFALWTMKESYVKYSGEGIASSFKEIVMGPDDTVLNRSIENSQEIYCTSFKKRKIRFSLCSHSRGEGDFLKKVAFKKLLENVSPFL